MLIIYPKHKDSNPVLPRSWYLTLEVISTRCGNYKHVVEVVVSIWRQVLEHGKTPSFERVRG